MKPGTLKAASRHCLALVLLPTAGVALAASPEITGNLLLDGILSTLIYGALGLAMAALGFMMVDKLTPGSLSEQIGKHENVALAILTGLVVLGICIIIAAVLVG